MICLNELESRIAAVNKCTPIKALQIIQDMKRKKEQEYAR